MRLAVFTGGSSAERSVAIASATQVVRALRGLGHEVVVVDTAAGILDGTAESKLLTDGVSPAPPDLEALAESERAVLLGGLLSDPRVAQAERVVLALHGGRGEDGTIQHLLDMAQISYTGAGALASALAMDKDLAKRLFRHAGVPVADWLMVVPSRRIGADVGAEVVEATLGLPVVVKPSKQGSTVGLSVVHEGADLDVAIKTALQHDDEVMIERFIAGRELTVGVLGSRALAVGEIIPNHDLFDYECKYTPGMSQELFPADISTEQTDEIRRLALIAHRSLKVSGYSRIDFRMDPDGSLFCLEVNTLPGMTATSLLPQSAAAEGIDFETLCEGIVKEE